MKAKKKVESKLGEHQRQTPTSTKKSSQTRTLPVPLKYAAAVISVIVAIAILHWWNAEIFDPAHVLFLLCAVLLSTWIGGLGPGLLAMTLSLLAFIFYYVAPINSLAVKASELPRLLVFGSATFAVVWLTAAQKRTTESLRQAGNELTRNNLLLQKEVNERKQVEKALRESEAKLKEAGQLANIGYWERDPIADRITWSEETKRIFGLQSPERVITQSQLLEMIYPEDRPLPQRALVEALQEGRSYDVEFRIVRPDGDLRYIHVRDEIEYNESGQPIRMFGALQDITERKRAEEEIRRHVARMEVLAEISRASEAVGLDYKNCLDTLVRRTAELIGDACLIMLFSDDGQLVYPGAFYHRDPAAQAMFREAITHNQPSSTDNQYHRTLLSGNSFYLPVVNEADFRIMFTPEITPVLDAHGISSFISVPLRAQNHVIGGLAIARDSHGTPYTHDDHVLLQELADRAALTIQNARLFEQTQEARQRLQALSNQLLEVQEEERRAIARELHDEIGQTLSGLMMQVGTAKNQLPKSAKSTRSILDQMEILIQQILERARMIIAGLRPPVLDDLGLIPALRRLGDEFREKAGVQVEIQIADLPKRLPAHLELALFRIVQEALINVRKHAQAQRVNITLAEEDRKLMLSIQDDGVGFENQTVPPRSSGELILEGGWRIPAGHFGLIGIQERVMQLGGRLDLTSVPEQGTTLHIEIPLTETKAVSDENP